MATLPYWNNDEVISSDKLNSMVQAIINGDPLAVKVSNTTKNDVNQIISYLSSLYVISKTNLNPSTSTSDLDTAYTDMMSLVSNRIGFYANDDTVDLYSTGIRASIITFLQAYDSMMSSDRLNNKNTDNTLSGRIDSERNARIQDTNSAIKNLSSKINQTADDITSTVNSTKQDLQGQIDSANTKINQTADGITSTVSRVEGKLNNLKISSRNYIKNSESIIMHPNGTDNYDLVWYVYNDAFAHNAYCHDVNKTRFSFYLKPSKALSTARTFRIYWRADPYTSFGAITVPANTTDTQYYELTTTTPTSQPIASQIFIRFMAQDTSDISYTITNSMLTIGDSFPDWQPAPEDTDSAIDVVSSKIDQTANSITSTVNSVKQDLQGKIDTANTKITQTADSITSTVNSTKQDLQGQITQTADDINDKVSDVNGKIDSTKQDLQGQIDNANTKITQTADSITEQLKSYSKTSDIQKYVDTTVQKTADGITSTVNSTKQDLQGQITQTADDINDKVSDVNGKIDSTKQDLQGQIDTANSKITQTADSITEQLKSYSKTSDIQKYVDTTVQKTADGITSTVNSTKQDLQGQIDNANTKITQTADSISSTINSTKQDLQGKIDSANTKITQTSDSITEQLKGYSKTIDMQKYVDTTVQKTADGITSTVSGVETSLANTKQDLQGQITQTANDINGKVSGVENKVDIANSKINNLSTSDRNLARGTSDSWTDFTGFDNKINYCDLLGKIYLDSLQVGDVITVGITLKNTGITSGTVSIQGCGNVTGWGNGCFGGKDLGEIAKSVPTGTTKTIMFTKTMTAENLENDYWVLQIRTDNVPKGGTLSYKCFFVKKGNIPTSWTPAPEDVQTQIDANKTATANAQSTANSAQSTALNANTTANSALTKANSAVTTANSANATANQANSTASSVVSVANQANTNATSAVNTANQANTTANSANTNANQAVTTANSANNKVTAIQANGGGRNLLVGSDPTLSNSPSLDGVIEVDFDGVKAWKSTSNSSNIMYNNISLEANTAYTYSALISADADGGLGFLCYGHFQVKNPNAHNQSDPTHEDIPSKRDYHGITVRANRWTRIYYTFTTNDLSGSTFGVYPSLVDGNLTDGNNNPTVYIRHLMLEKGTIAHDWQSAPEDVDAKITTNSTAIEQNKKAIALKADQETVNQTNGAVQQLQSQLNIQAGQIDSKVSSSDLDARGYATQAYTQTQIKQTSDQWNLNLAKLKNDTQASMTDLSATVNGLTTTVGKVDDRVKKIEDNTDWTTVTGPLDMNTLTTTQNIYYRDSSLKNADGETGWAYIQVISMGERVTQTVWHDRSSIQHTRTGAVNGSSYDWDAWNEVATNAQVTAIKQTVDGIQTQVYNSDGSSKITQLSNAIATKVSSSDLDAKGYATQAYTQTQIKQTADGITSTVNSTKQDLQGKIDSANNRIDQTATDISNVNTKVEQYKTGINQTATGMNLFAQVITGNKSIDVTKSNIGIDPNQIKIASNKIVIDGDTEFRGNGKWLDGKYINIEKLNHTENNTDYMDSVAFDSGGIIFSEYTRPTGTTTALSSGNSKLGAVINVDYYQNKKVPGLSIVGNDVGMSAEPMGNTADPSSPVSHLLLRQGDFTLDAAQASGRGTIVGISGDITTGNLTLDGNVELSGQNMTVQQGMAITVKATPATQDKLMVVAQKNSNSTQDDYAQPTLRAGQSLANLGDSGLTFYWNSVKAFGTFDLRDTHVLGNRNTHFSVETTFDTDGEANMCFTWTSRSDLWNNDKLPMLARADWWTSQWGSGGIGIANGHLFFFTNDGRTYRLIG